MLVIVTRRNFLRFTSARETTSLLPSLPHLQCVLLPRGDGRPQVDGQLSDVHEAMLVASGRVQRQQLHQTVLHEVDSRERVERRELAVPDKSEVGFLVGREERGGRERGKGLVGLDKLFLFLAHYSF